MAKRGDGLDMPEESVRGQKSTECVMLKFGEVTR